MRFEHQLKSLFIIGKTHAIGARLKRETALGYFFFQVQILKWIFELLC